MNKPTQATLKTIPLLITEKTLGQMRSPDQILYFQFLQALGAYVFSDLSLVLLFDYMYTRKFLFAGCFLMILQENPAYTIIFVEDPRNHLFLWENGNVWYQKKMQLEWNVLILFHTESSLCKQLTDFT